MTDYTLGKKFKLTDDQNDIVKFMLDRPNAICSAQTGFGKTYTMSTALCHALLKTKDSIGIIVCPVKALKAFRKELREKLNVSFDEYTSSGIRHMSGSRIILITHTAIGKYIDEIKVKAQSHNLFCLVDECHALETPNSKFYSIMSELRPYFKIWWGCTATPLKNNIEGLYYLINLAYPGVLGTYPSFASMFLITQRKQVTTMVGKGRAKRKSQRTVVEIIGYKNIDYLKKILSDLIIIKQKHYNLEFHYHSVKLDSLDNTNKNETSAYIKAAKGSARASAKDSFAVRLHDLQMVVDNIDDYIPEVKGNKKLSKDELKYEEELKHKRILSRKLSSKEVLLFMNLKKAILEGHPCLVYCDYTEVVDRLEHLINMNAKTLGVKQVLKITGNVPQKKREAVEDLIEEGTVVLLTSAGTESINLQRADTLFFYDIPFAIQTFLQAVGRVTRIDSKFSSQHIHIIEAFGTIDTYKRLLIQLNGNLISQVFGSIETLPVEISTIDKKMQANLRKALLWIASQGRLIEEEDLQRILNK